MRLVTSRGICSLYGRLRRNETRRGALYCPASISALISRLLHDHLSDICTGCNVPNHFQNFVIARNLKKPTHRGVRWKHIQKGSVGLWCLIFLGFRCNPWNKINQRLGSFFTYLQRTESSPICMENKTHCVIRLCGGICVSACVYINNHAPSIKWWLKNGWFLLGSYKTFTNGLKSTANFRPLMDADYTWFGGGQKGGPPLWNSK